MFKIIKDGSYTVFKMFLNQIAMTIFGLAVGLSTWNYEKLSIAASVFAVIFYLVLLYTMTWEYGYEHSQLISSGRLKYNPLTGLILSVTANLVNIVLGVMAIVGYYGASGYVYYNELGEEVADIALSIGRAPASPDWAANIFGIGKSFSAILNAMYSGLISSFFRFSPNIYLIIVLPSVAVCTAAYILGTKGKHFTKLVGNKPNVD
ncbi:MAG: hypothetical protein KBT31_05035 [Firmicutes bacterium]|nr:hypothetical protein [Candidatus Colimorpha enterica]